jgi:hypothetical protein
VTGLLLITFALGFQSGDDVAGDEILLKELRARGLTELTEAHSRRRLSNPKLDPAAREAAAIELAAATSRRASTETDATARRAGWKEADSILEPWLRAAEGNEPEKFEFRLRHALLIRDRAETAVDLLKAVPNDKDLAEDARDQARQAADLLTKLADEVRRRMNQSVGGDPKKFDRLANLDIRVDFHAGIAWMIAATATPAGAAKTSAAEEADKRLRTYTRTFSILALNMESILALGKLYKEMERYDEGLQVLSVFEVHPEAPAPYPQRAELLAAQIMLAQNKPAAALAKLNVPENKRVPNSGEWEVTLFEAMLRGSRTDIGAPKERRDEAINLLASLEKKFGGYWKVRGEQVLAKFGDPSVIGDDAGLLARVASLRRERKEFAAAIDMFDRAAELERASGATEKAARVAVSAAATVLEKGDAAGAAQRFQKIAEELGPAPLAADAYLGAARALYPASQAGDAKARVAYRAVLDQLLALPKPEPAIKNEAAWLRARLADAEKDVPAAVRYYREIPADHARAAAALGALASAYYEMLLGEKGKFAGERTVAAAVEDLESRLKAITDVAPEAAKNRAIAAWVLARMIAEHQPERLSEAVRLAETTVIVEPSFPKPQNRVWELLLAWKLRLGDGKGAAATAAQGFSTDPNRLANTLLSLSPLEDGISVPEAAARTEAGEAAVAMWLAKDQLPDRTRTSFKLLSGQVLAAKKDYADAVRLLRQLREESPRDPRIARVLGAVLFRAGEYRESLQEWNNLVVGLQQGREEWLAAVVEACRCHLELGDRAAATNLLKIVETNHRGKGSEGVRAKLAEIKKRVER